MRVIRWFTWLLVQIIPLFYVIELDLWVRYVNREMPSLIPLLILQDLNSCFSWNTFHYSKTSYYSCSNSVLGSLYKLLSLGGIRSSFCTQIIQEISLGVLYDQVIHCAVNNHRVIFTRELQVKRIDVCACINSYIHLHTK